MDFVVSKVAMSICALLVVSVLGGVLESDILFRDFGELESILADLSIAVERSAWSGCEGVAIWEVPFLPDGENVEISIRSTLFHASASGRSAALKPACEPHTWVWDGAPLNLSAVSALDASSPATKARSGQAIEIRTWLVSYENSESLFVFVRAST